MRNRFLGFAASIAICAAVMLASTWSARADEQSRLDVVVQRGKLIVVTLTTVPPYAFKDEKGDLVGIDVDIAHLIANALFKDPNKIEFISVTSDGRWPAIESGRADLGVGGTTVYMDRALHVAFTDAITDSSMSIMVSKLAVDVYLPAARENGPSPSVRLPTILIVTPYYRRFRLRDDAPAGTEPSPNTRRYRECFVPHGYAMVILDVRGTGASFGTRDSFRSPAERDDSREVVDWIIAQDWSDGTVGATGISYLGAAASFLASTGHPAVRAIAPLFAVWDTYTDHYYPGGILLNRLAEDYDRLMIGLDHDRRDLLREFAYFGNPAFAGPQPVDDDGDGALCTMAVREHLGSFRMPDFITEFRYRDDRLPYDESFGSPSFSPYHYAADIPEDVAIYSVSGWMDGGGFTNGAIARFLSLPNPRRHLLLGPWDHGARTNVSPWRAQAEPEFPLLGEILRFFDEYLLGRDTGLRKEALEHYYTMHEERWRAASTWPVLQGTRTFHCDGSGILADAAGEEGHATYLAEFTVGTGRNTRYERLASIGTTEYYRDWDGRDARMLCYTSAPLNDDAEISGHPVLTLWLASDQGDAAVHVYLSEIEADGKARYVTEGVLRALHRAESPAPEFERWTWPYHDFTRGRRKKLPADGSACLRFALLPTSWTFRAGSRIRLLISGADADHFAHVPHGRPPLMQVFHGRVEGSHLTLPWRTLSNGDPATDAA